MQLSGDAALDAAVNATDRKVVYKVEIDWNRNGLYDHTLSDVSRAVESVRVDRNVNGALPPESTLLEGYYSGQLQLQLSGKTASGHSIVQQMAMWRTDSLLFGQARTGVRIRVHIGHRTSTGAETLVPQFVGTIIDCKVLSGPGLVAIIANDLSEDMRGSIDLPTWGMSIPSQLSQSLNLSLRVNNQWPIDYVFRKNGYYSSPKPHSRVFWAATMHGSPVPEIGHRTQYLIGEGILTDEESAYRPGRPGWGLAYGGTPTWWAAISSRAEVTGWTGARSQTLVMQCQVETTNAEGVYPGQPGALFSWSSGTSYSSGNTFILYLTSTRRLMLNTYQDTTLRTSTLGPTLAAGWQDAWVEIEISASGVGSTLRWVGGTTSTTDLSGLYANPPGAGYSTVVIFGQQPIQDVHMSNRTGLAAGATRYNPATWTPQYDLDTSLNEVIGLPIRRGVSSWDLLREIVGAEFGTLGFSESGRPFFYNRDTIRRSTLTTTRTLTNERTLSEISLTERGSARRNVITAPVAEIRRTGPIDSTKAWVRVFELQDSNMILLPPGNSSFRFTLDVPGGVLSEVDPTLMTTAAFDAAASDPSVHGFAAIRVQDGTQVSSGITASVTPLSPTTSGNDVFNIGFANTGGWAKLRTTGGDPALRLRGLGMVRATEKVYTWRRETSIADIGEKVLDLPSSEWYQSPDQLAALAYSLLKDLSSPVPLVDQIESVGDCRAQLTDAVLIEDKAMLGGPFLCTLSGITRSLLISGAGAKLTDTLSVRPVAAPGKWILGHSVWSVLGQTTRV